MAKPKTASKTSPKASNKGCLGDDGKYSIENCNGDLQNQGVGGFNNQTNSVIIRIER